MTYKIAPRPALFLDRDGVLLNVTKDNLVPNYEIPEWIPGCIYSLLHFAVLDVPIIVISNHPCRVDRKIVDKLHYKMSEECNLAITAFYYYSHTGFCYCEMPTVGLLYTAIREYNISPHKSLYVGDTYEDMVIAGEAGINPIWVASGLGEEPPQPPIVAFDSLLQSVEYIEHWFIGETGALCLD